MQPEMIIPHDIKHELRRINELVREYNHYLHKTVVNFSAANKMDTINKEISTCTDKLSRLQEEHFSKK